MTKERDEFPDIPLFEEKFPEQGIKFSMDLSPHAPPEEAPAARCFPALLTDSLLFLLLFLIYLYLIARLLPATPVLPRLIASLAESLMLAIAYSGLSVFFWGATPGMALFSVRVGDAEGENPDATMLLGWLGHHIVSLITLGFYGSIIPYSVRRSFFLLDNRPTIG